jgi:class 3 adenylate cyclase
MTASTQRSQDDRDPEVIGAVERFPGQNPHPVMRVGDDGRLLYANDSSRPLLDTAGIDIGDPLPADWVAGLADVIRTGRPMSVPVGARTFELLAVQVAELGFTNVYGTDVTAERAIVKFPDQNPNPVFRLSWGPALVYANRASNDLLDGLGASVGNAFPGPLGEELLAAARAADGRTVEAASRDRRYALLAVDVPEFGFVNVYGTDITAVRQLEVLHRENERLLLNVLPEPIADRLRHGERLIADRFDDVTLMFADIVDFTRMSSGMSPDRLVTVLNDVFTVFDRLVEEHRLEKVKTIGDAYMVVGGMPEPLPGHCGRVASMALALAAAVESLDAARALGVRFRVGIHCGPVIAGIIGEKKFIYDVWGDTVNVASRMESTGVPGRIQVTSTVADRLRERFRLEPRGTIDIKGKGAMATWFLTGSNP